MQSKSYYYWRTIFLSFIVLSFLAVLCQETKGSDIRDRATRKSSAAEYYSKQKNCIKAKNLCEEAISLWNQIKERRIETTPDWLIDKHISRCENILNTCSEYNKGRLFVDTIPSDATVRVLDIGPRFHQQGMRLDPGKHSLEVSAPGYQTKIFLTKLSPGEEKTITVDLQTSKVSEVETKPSDIDNERKRLAEEPKRSRDEQELADIPKKMSGTRVSLRTEPKKLLERDIRMMLARYGFYDADLNWRGSFTNDFVDNGNGTITDRATGLMWQKSGSSRAKTLKRAKTYVKQLNMAQFAGYSDWRLPTIEEFVSLVEREKVNGVHIDPLFDNKQKMCWSSDKADPFGGHTGNPPQIWIVNFAKGGITTAIMYSEILSIYSTSEYNYVRAI
jgi:hypothetical protein